MIASSRRMLRTTEMSFTLEDSFVAIVGTHTSQLTADQCLLCSPGSLLVEIMAELTLEQFI